MKDDEDKLQWSLLPWAELEHVVAVLQYGAQKYGAGSWKTLDNFEQRYKDALLRHTAAYMMGQTFDDDSYQSHLAHIVANALFLLWKENSRG